MQSQTSLRRLASLGGFALPAAFLVAAATRRLHGTRSAPSASAS
jgi:hypothetical protein